MIAHGILALELCLPTSGQCSLKGIKHSGLLAAGAWVQVCLHAEQLYYIFAGRNQQCLDALLQCRNSRGTFATFRKSRCTARIWFFKERSLLVFWTATRRSCALDGCIVRSDDCVVLPRGPPLLRRAVVCKPDGAPPRAMGTTRRARAASERGYDVLVPQTVRLMPGDVPKIGGGAFIKA